MLIGAHIRPSDPLGVAAAEGLGCVQFFLGNPQSWKAPVPRADVEALRAADLPIYVHAPYLVNVASPNNRVRIPSRRILQETCDGAAAIGATAVIVHGGSVAEDGDLEASFGRWRATFERLESTVPVYVENTAGGEGSVARRIEVIGRLWEHIGEFGAGFCFDTCHAHSAGELLPDAVDRARAATGRIDLLHCNDSRDPAGSGRDRHTNIGAGCIDLDALAETVRRAGTTVLVETPDEGRPADLAWLRALV